MVGQQAGEITELRLSRMRSRLDENQRIIKWSAHYQSTEA